MSKSSLPIPTFEELKHAYLSDIDRSKNGTSAPYWFYYHRTAWLLKHTQATKEAITVSTIRFFEKEFKQLVVEVAQSILDDVFIIQSYLEQGLFDEKKDEIRSAILVYNWGCVDVENSISESDYLLKLNALFTVYSYIKEQDNMSIDGYLWFKLERDMALDDLSYVTERFDSIHQDLTDLIY